MQKLSSHQEEEDEGESMEEPEDEDEELMIWTGIKQLKL